MDVCYGKNGTVLKMSLLISSSANKIQYESMNCFFGESHILSHVGVSVSLS